MKGKSFSLANIIFGGLFAISTATYATTPLEKQSLNWMHQKNLSYEYQQYDTNNLYLVSSDYFDYLLNSIQNNYTFYAYIDSNYFSKEQILQILTVLKGNTSVQQLHLYDGAGTLLQVGDGNHDDDFIIALIDALTENNSITNLSINGGYWDEVTDEFISRNLDSNLFTKIINTVINKKIPEFYMGGWNLNKKITLEITHFLSTEYLKSFGVDITNVDSICQDASCMILTEDILDAIKNSNLENVYLWSQKSIVNSTVGELIANAVLSASSLTGVYLDNINITLKAAETFSSLLSKNRIINFNIWSGDVSDAAFLTLQPGLIQNTSLKEFSISTKGFQDPATVLPLIDYYVNALLESFGMIGYGNPNIVLSENAMALLTDKLATDSTLFSLQLSGLGITDGGMQLLADSLKSNTRLQYLYLNDNLYTNSGLLAVASTLENNHSIQYISLDWPADLIEEYDLFWERLYRNEMQDNS